MFLNWQLVWHTHTVMLVADTHSHASGCFRHVQCKIDEVTLHRLIAKVKKKDVTKKITMYIAP